MAESSTDLRPTRSPSRSTADWVELKPEDAGTAEREMRLAATEWLEVEMDPSRRKEYCDRWVREMGYFWIRLAVGQGFTSP